MRTFIPVTLFLLFLLPVSLLATPVKGYNSLVVLKKEVESILRKNISQFPDARDQAVTVGFMINAKDELIVLDVDSDSTSACDYVKEVLNYRKVKYCQAKQLTRYTLTIHLVKEKF